MRHEATTQAAIAVLCLLGIAVGSRLVDAAAETFEASLSSMPYNDATRETLKGRGRITVVAEGNTLAISGRFSGLASAATDARVMVGRGIGVPGPPGWSLEISH